MLAAREEDAAGVGVTGFGDGTLAALLTGGVLARDAVADFSDGGDGDGIVDPAQGLEGVDERMKAPGGDVFGELALEALEAVDRVPTGPRKTTSEERSSAA